MKRWTLPKTLRFRLTLGFATGLAGLLICSYEFSHTVTFLDRPSVLSNRQETVSAIYVDWMCNCPKFVEKNKYKTDPTTEPADEDYFYIEPANTRLSVNYDSLFRKPLVLMTGRFYTNRGVPSEFKLGHIEDKPARAKVFRFDSIRYLPYGDTMARTKNPPVDSH